MTHTVPVSPRTGHDDMTMPADFFLGSLGRAFLFALCQAQVENISLEEHLAVPKRTSLKEPAAVVRGDLVAWIIQDRMRPSNSFSSAFGVGVVASRSAT